MLHCCLLSETNKSYCGNECRSGRRSGWHSIKGFVRNSEHIKYLSSTASVQTRKLTTEGQRFSFWRVLTSSMHIPFCPTHIPFCSTHWCWHLVCTFHSPPPVVLTSSMHFGWTTRFWHKILQHILSECITESSLRKLMNWSSVEFRVIVTNTALIFSLFSLSSHSGQLTPVIWLALTCNTLCNDPISLKTLSQRSIDVSTNMAVYSSH